MAKYTRFIKGIDTFGNNVFICIESKSVKSAMLPLADLTTIYTPKDGNSWYRSDYYKTGINDKPFTVNLVFTDVDVIMKDFKIERKGSEYMYSMGAMRPTRIEEKVVFADAKYLVGDGFEYDLNNILQSSDLRFDVRRK